MTTATKTPSRVYLITSPTAVRLVKAHTQAQAIRFAVGTDYAAQVATQDDLITNLATMQVEDATKVADEPQETAA